MDEISENVAVNIEEEPEHENKNSISADLIRGHINTIILRSLYDRDKYGYEIIDEIDAKSHGQYTLKQPTLYSALKRLETQGYIKAYWKTDEVSAGGRRKYFMLTESGREIAEKNQAEWEYSRTIIDSLISDKSFDFSQPAPTAIDFKILKQSTSRVPIVKGDPDDDFDASYIPSNTVPLVRADGKTVIVKTEEEMLEERAKIESELREQIEAAERAKYEEQLAKVEEEKANFVETQQALLEEEKAKLLESQQALYEEEKAKLIESQQALFEEEKTKLIETQHAQLEEERAKLSEELLKIEEEKKLLDEERSKTEETKKLSDEERAKAEEEYRNILEQERRRFEEERMRLEEAHNRTILEQQAQFEQERARIVAAERARSEQEQAKIEAEFARLEAERAKAAAEEEQRRLKHENYLKLINSPVASASNSNNQTNKSTRLIYNDKPKTERDYKNLVNNLFAGTVKRQPEIAVPVQPQNNAEQTTSSATVSDNAEVLNANSKAANDGLKLNTASNMGSTRNTDKRSFDMGANLFKSSLIVMVVILLEFTLCLLFKTNLQISVAYPIVLLSFGVAQLLIFAVIYFTNAFKGFRKPMSIRYISASIVVTILLIFITCLVSLLLKINFTVTADVMVKLVIPSITMLNIPIFTLSFYLFSK